MLATLINDLNYALENPDTYFKPVTCRINNSEKAVAYAREIALKREKNEREIIRVLKEHGPLRTVDLAKLLPSEVENETHVKRTTCFKRMLLLEEEGVVGRGGVPTDLVWKLPNQTKEQ